MTLAASIGDKIKAAKECCCAALRKLNSLDDLMNKPWEIFVIKLDADSGEYITETLCCMDSIEIEYK